MVTPLQFCCFSGTFALAILAEKQVRNITDQSQSLSATLTENEWKM